MTRDKRINYRGSSRYRGRSSGPGPGGQGARGQATQNPGRAPRATPVQNVHQTGAVTQTPGRAPRATPVQNVHQTGAVTQTPGRPTYQNVHQTGAVTQTPGRPASLYKTNQVNTAVVPQVNTTRPNQMLALANNPQWRNMYAQRFNQMRANQPTSFLGNLQNLYGIGNIRLAASYGKDTTVADAEARIKAGVGTQADHDLVAAQGSTTGGSQRADIADPDVLLDIARVGGLTNIEEGFFKDKEVLQPGAKIAIEDVQKFKYDEKLSPEKIIEYFGDEGKYKGMDLETLKKVYDMAQVTGQSPVMAANGGLINLFKYGGFLG